MINKSNVDMDRDNTGFLKIHYMCLQQRYIVKYNMKMFRFRKKMLAANYVDSYL